MKIKLPKRLSNIKASNIPDLLMLSLRRGAVHAFEVSLGFVLISVILGLAAYLKYKSPEIKNALPESIPTQFRTELYRETLEKLEERNMEFEEAAKKEYSDPFYPEQSELTDKE